MAAEGDDLWQALARSGEQVATDEDYEHGYKQREVRRDLRHYVSFRVGDEIYGLAIGEIEEITKQFPTTFVPRTADFLLGIGNVRGRIIPVVELARRLGLRSSGYDRAARVLIVTLDEPETIINGTRFRTAGLTAAPVAAKVLARIAPVMGLRPQTPGKEATPVLYTLAGNE